MRLPRIQGRVFPRVVHTQANRPSHCLCVLPLPRGQCSLWSTLGTACATVAESASWLTLPSSLGWVSAMHTNFGGKFSLDFLRSAPSPQSIG